MGTVLRSLGMGFGLWVSGTATCGPAQYAEEADAVAPLATTDAAREWLAEAARLPEIEARVVYYSFRPKRGYTTAQYDELSEDDRDGLTRADITTDETYYDTFYGTPIAYMRALDLASAAIGDGFGWDGARILDYGYGQLGQLRMLAQCGADVTGVDVDPILQAIYSEPGDQGAVAGRDDRAGSVRLLHGYWPNDDPMVEAVGDGYDLIISRNLLKRGYIAPTDGSDAWVDMGLPDEEILGRFFDALAPGGVLMIYSLGGRPPEDRYSPSTDIANPWSRQQWEAAGFEVLAHDFDENAMARRVGDLLGWDEGEHPMDLETSLFGVFSVLRRPIE